jgi:hypothetical protein
MTRQCRTSGCRQTAINGWGRCWGCLKVALAAPVQSPAERPAGGGLSAGDRTGRESDGARSVGGRAAPSRH